MNCGMYGTNRERIDLAPPDREPRFATVTTSDQPEESRESPATQPGSGRRGAREERIDRLIEELRESIHKTDAMIDRLREKGILRPREQDTRV
jgi:hypothetical protein